MATQTAGHWESASCSERAGSFRHTVRPATRTKRRAEIPSLQGFSYSNSAGATAVNASNGSDTPDPVAGNDVANVSVQVGFAVEGIPALGNDGLILLALALALLGAVSVRRDR
ncbi:MAG: IPTL-CTERM sorting domain-containing protein [Lysobacterales bacterium]